MTESVMQVLFLEEILFLPYSFAQLKPKAISFALPNIGIILLDILPMPFHKL